MAGQGRKRMWWLLIVPGVVVAGLWAYLQHPKFGTLPSGEHLATLEASDHYGEEGFHNRVETPMFAEEASMASVLIGNLSDKSERLRPERAIPALDTDLRALDVDEDIVVWLGHSSYYAQLGGKRFLIDPVFSDSAAPVPFVNRAFAGTNGYGAEDMPPIDVLLITHDHWDHLDYPSVMALKGRVDRVITGLGVGAYFEGWGFDSDRISEGNWFDAIALDGDTTLHLIPARHYSGRLLKRDRTLWTGFVLETPRRRLLFSGDTGDGPHFEEIAQRFDGFDLVSLDHGQYDARWPYIHMTPEQAADAADRLGARALISAHVGKFTLARHAWDEPMQRISAASEGRDYRLLTPVIGEPVRLSRDASQSFEAWWE
ncbi:beta-lactamase [Halomonas salina]|uniref:Beta-lactamase n=2 Tax=Halomonas salina TaxID=42565 RepID=A0ABR4WQH2_9GAMM|nr:beta-lactamase [Halomonas salina]